MNDPARTDGLPATRAEAVALGLTRYFTGKPCTNGHVSPRYTRGQCIACDAIHRQKRDPEVHAARERARYAAKPDLMRARSREAARRHREAKKDERNAYLRRWHAENLEQSKAIKAKYRRQNPEQGRLDAQRRRCRLKGVDGSFTVSDIERITERQGGRCACCRKKRKLTIDHITPLAKGGSNWPRNIQMLCKSCNSRKQARDPIEFMQSMGALL